MGHYRYVSKAPLLSSSNRHLCNCALLTDDLQASVFSPLQPSRPVLAHSPLRVGSLCAARPVRQPVLTTAADRGLTVLAQRDAGAQTESPYFSAIVSFGELLVESEGQGAEGCIGGGEPWLALFVLFADGGVLYSQSDARKPPARPEAHWNNCGLESTTWILSGLVFPDCDRK